jgi:hypothetical protein
MKELGLKFPLLDEKGGAFWFHGRDTIDWRIRVFSGTKKTSFKTLRKILLEDRYSHISKEEIFIENMEAIPFDELRSK